MKEGGKILKKEQEAERMRRSKRLEKVMRRTG